MFTSRLKIIQIMLILTQWQLISGGNLSEGALCWQNFNKRFGYCIPAYLCYHVNILQLDSKSNTCNHRSKIPLVCCPLFNKTEEDLRISGQKCKQFNKTVQSINISISWSSLHFTSNKNCTAKTLNNTNTNKSYESAIQNEYSHFAAIGWYDAKKQQIQWNCGGALINEHYVLTAAHCMIAELGFPDVVRIGAGNVKQHYTAVANEKNINKIHKIYIHPKYKSFKHYHDIALLKLSLPTTFTINVQPACLWQYSDVETSATFTSVTFQNIQNTIETPSAPITPIHLQMITLKSCQQIYGTERHLKYGLSAQQHICASPLISDNAMCQGNSGSPLYIQLPELNCMKFILGIASFGKSCALPHTPSVYIKTFPYLDWIESIAFAQ